VITPGDEEVMMISRHVGGEVAKGGCYWSITAGEFLSVPKEGGTLPGGSNDRYIKAPLPVVLVAGPIMGLGFAMFLPLSGVLVLVPFLIGKLRGAAAPSAAHMATPQMQPGMSYLEPQSGVDATAQETPEADGKGKLVDLAQEIAEKRWKEK
jgi:hypothetical protein